MTRSYRRADLAPLTGSYFRKGAADAADAMYLHQLELAVPIGEGWDGVLPDGQRWRLA